MYLNVANCYKQIIVTRRCVRLKMHGLEILHYTCCKNDVKIFILHTIDKEKRFDTAYLKFISTLHQNLLSKY